MRGYRSRLRRSAFGLVAASLVLTASALFAPHDVEACGGFFVRGVRRTHRPSLAYEQALILYDPITEREHFVREIAFRDGAEPFGFVVPTPTRAEVAKVERSPFEQLRSSFQFQPDPNAFGSGRGRLGGGSGVTVLEVSKVGKFTAFILAADDETGLARWLDDNGFASTPETEAWLAHYVRMRFHYVAMRYDPPKQVAAKEPNALLDAETIRISFSTPVPYYPYFEPRPPQLGAAGDRPAARLLELWVVSPAAVTPIVAKTSLGKTSWLRPMQEGTTSADGEPTRKTLEATLGEEMAKLLPPGPLVVQTFQDQKYSRVDRGDVLFAPAKRAPLDPAKAERLRPLLGILDPALVPEKGVGP